MTNHFNIPIIPGNDAERLKALQHYRMLDAIPPGYFAKLANIIARTFDTPIALISLVEKEHVEFVGNHGMEDTAQVSRGMSLCSLAVLDDELTIFPDALDEPCLLANPLVTGEFGLRFYAGAPIITSSGYAIGTACVVDKKPREFNEKDQQLLRYFADVAMREIEARHKNITAG